ncbi:MAG: hypothetical protein ACI9WU_004610 [Myxococcota bacterium]|jgi:hypothetical protein
MKNLITLIRNVALSALVLGSIVGCDLAAQSAAEAHGNVRMGLTNETNARSAVSFEIRSESNGTLAAQDHLTAEAHSTTQASLELEPGIYRLHAVVDNESETAQEAVFEVTSESVVTLGVEVESKLDALAELGTLTDSEEPDAQEPPAEEPAAEEPPAEEPAAEEPAPSDEDGGSVEVEVSLSISVGVEGSSSSSDTE